MKAVAAVSICALIQLILWFYSVSHPAASKLLTSSFLFTIVFYPIVFEYHARKMRIYEKRSSASRPDSN